MLNEIIIAANIGIWMNFFRETVYYSLKLKYGVRKNPNKLKFYLSKDISFKWVDNEIENFTEDVIVCQYWLTDNRFLEWKMDDSGKMITKTLTGKINKKGKPKTRTESILLFRERTPKEKTMFMKYKVIHVFSHYGPVAWAIKRYTAEHFVMAKLAGFEMYDINKVVFND